MIPSKGDAGDWEKVYNLNKELLKSDKAKNVDVVFFGDSITEGWRGTHFGKETSKTQGIRPVFDSLFSSVLGGKFDGIALGIAADTVSSETENLSQLVIQNFCQF
jgi:lysophospholipase L1-like esterase